MILKDIYRMINLNIREIFNFNVVGLGKRDIEYDILCLFMK